MRILMVNDYTSYGGAEVIFRVLSEELSAMGHDVIQITIDDLPLGWSGVHFLRGEGSLVQTKYFGRLLDELNPDVVHIHNFTKIGITPFRCAREREIPTIYTAHDYFIFCPSRTLSSETKRCPDCARCLTRRRFYKKIIDLPIAGYFARHYISKKVKEFKTLLIETLEETKIVTVSTRMGQIFSKHGFKCETIFNGLPDFRECQEHPRIRRKFILHTARLTREKGPHLLLGIAKKIPIQAYNKASLEILEAFCDSKLDYRGFVSREEILRALNECSGVISCSTWEEPFGLDILEGLIFEKPVIATKVGGHHDQIINGTNGYLLNINSEKFIEACNEILYDENKARLMGINGRRIYEMKFTIERCSSEYLRIYKKI